jgi:hypothetical protein
MGGQVAQHPDLALSERIYQSGPVNTRNRRLARRHLRMPLWSPGWPAALHWKQAEDLGGQRGVLGAVQGVSLQQPRRGVDEEGQENAIGLGGIERALKRASGGGRVAERVPGDGL